MFTKLSKSSRFTKFARFTRFARFARFAKFSKTITLLLLVSLFATFTASTPVFGSDSGAYARSSERYSAQSFASRSTSSKLKWNDSLYGPGHRELITTAMASIPECCKYISDDVLTALTLYSTCSDKWLEPCADGTTLRDYDCLHLSGNYVCNLRFLYNIAYRLKHGEDVEKALAAERYYKVPTDSYCRDELANSIRVMCDADFSNSSYYNGGFDTTTVVPAEQRIIAANGINYLKSLRALGLVLHLAGDLYAHCSIVPVEAINYEAKTNDTNEADLRILRKSDFKSAAKAEKYRKLITKRKAVTINAKRDDNMRCQMFGRIPDYLNNAIADSYCDNAFFWPERYSGAEWANKSVLQNFFIEDTTFNPRVFLPNKYVSDSYSIQLYRLANYCMPILDEFGGPDSEETKLLSKLSFNYTKQEAALSPRSYFEVDGISYASLTNTTVYAYDCHGITNLKIPSKVNCDGKMMTVVQVGSAFNIPGYETKSTLMTEGSSCTNVTFPKTVSYIGARAFAGLPVKKITFNSAIKSKKDFLYIGLESFADCSSLRSVGFKNGRTSIGKLAFSRCNIPTLKLPAQTIKIHDNAFLGSTIRRLILDYRTYNIQPRAFTGAKIKKIVMKGRTRHKYTVANGCLFSKNKRTLYCATTPKTTLNVRKGTQKILGGAFACSSNVKKIVLPSSVRSVDLASLAHTQVKTVVFKGKKPTMKNADAIKDLEIKLVF